MAADVIILVFSTSAHNVCLIFHAQHSAGEPSTGAVPGGEPVGLLDGLHIWTGDWQPISGDLTKAKRSHQQVWLQWMPAPQPGRQWR